MSVKPSVNDTPLSRAGSLLQGTAYNLRIRVDTDMTERCNSYYTATLNQDTDYPILQGRHKVDVVIIGGGFTGVATAVELAEKGLKVAIVESHKIGWGATGRNGGQVLQYPDCSGAPDVDGAGRRRHSRDRIFGQFHRFWRSGAVHVFGNRSTGRTLDRRGHRRHHGHTYGGRNQRCIHHRA